MLKKILIKIYADESLLEALRKDAGHKQTSVSGVARAIVLAYYRRLGRI